MKRLPVALIAGAILGSWSGFGPGQAATFGQQELDQSKFVAIAAPYHDGAYYKLLIIEQVSESQPCWAETNPATGEIDPLLLKFDFTNICGRSSDGNSYSIRRAGQDLAMEYGLRVVKREGYLALIGAAHDNPTGPAIEIGRTQSISSGFTKITLNPGWQLTKRTFNDKTLGHIYLTHDTPVPDPGTPRLANRPASQQSPKVTSQPQPVRSSQKSTSVAVTTRTSNNSSNNSRKTSKTPALFQRPVAKASTPTSTSRATPATAIEIPVELSPPPSTPAPRPQAVSPPAAGVGGETAVALPPPLTQDSADQPALPVLTAGAPALPGSSPPPSTQPISSSPPAATPEAVTAVAGSRYRVLVETPNSQRQDQIRELVPDAFRASYQGRPAMQVGSFENQAEAETVIELMKKNGFNPVVDVSAANPSTMDIGTSNQALLPVPQAPIPMGSGSTPVVYDPKNAIGSANDPPPPPELRTVLGHRYRVMVSAQNSAQQAQIRSLVPDAFRASYQGKSMMQVGAFKQRSEADPVIQLMSSNGFQPILDVNQ